MSEDSKSIKSVFNLDSISEGLILLLVFLLPIFFIPLGSAPFQFTKTFLVFTAVFLAFIVFVVGRLRHGVLGVPRDLLLLAAWLLPLVYLVTAFFSQDISRSVTGLRFEVDTFYFIVILTLLLTLTAFLFSSKKGILRVYLTLFASFIVLSLFQILRLIFGADFLSFGIFVNPVDNLVGKWNDLAIFYGLVVLLALVSLAALRLNTVSKVALYVGLLAALFMLAVVNFMIVWIVVALFSLGFFVYTISRGWTKKKNPALSNDSGPTNPELPLVALVVLALSVIFIVQSNTFGAAVSSILGINHIEARPSWTSTLSIARETYKNNILFGSGPNTFGQQWTTFKPTGVNETPFWNVDFSLGIGFIPTSFITTGILGGLAWLLFFMAFIYTAVRTLILSPPADRLLHYLMLSAFLAALYLWIFSVIYVPSTVILTLTFLFTGIFIAAVRSISRQEDKVISFADNPRLGFIATLLLTVLLFGGIASLYLVGQRYVSAWYLQRGLIAFNIEGNIDEAERFADRALVLGSSPTHYRLITDIDLIRLNQLLSRSDLTAEQLQDEFQGLFAQAVGQALEATENDPNDYQYWRNLARIYQVVVPLNIEGSYEAARRAYEQARQLNPTNPGITLDLARLELVNGSSGGAREYITKALEQKSNYTTAIFLLTQIEIAEGNISRAIEAAEAAVLIEPNNPVAFFQLGFLYYNSGTVGRSIGSLERAVELNPSYSNARYFLGLSYDQVERTSEALIQFESIEKLDPGNEEVARILLNLKEGRQALSNIAPPPPEEREELPIEE